MGTNELPLVSIQCLVYNHEPYLRQCLDGFVMQKTNFKFEAIVHDDVSTDGSAAIIREYAEKYPDIIKPIFETENQYSKRDGSLDRIMHEACKGKYIALCEGDDYWIDPLKLQKQVDFLEQHSEYVLSHTSFSYLIEYNNNEIRNTDAETVKNLNIINNDVDNIVAYILNYNEYRIQTPTVLFRRDVYHAIQKDKVCQKEPLFMMGDTPLWVRLCQYGKIHFLQDCTAIYRAHFGSACRSVNKIEKMRFDLSCAEMRMYFSSLYNIKKSYKHKLENDYNIILFKYMIYNHSYKPMYKIYHNVIEKYLLYSLILPSPFILTIIKPFYHLCQLFKLSNLKSYVREYICKCL